MSGFEIDLATFNMAKATLHRLHVLRIEASDARREYHLMDWLNILNAEYYEIVTMVKIEETEEEKVKACKELCYQYINNHKIKVNCKRTTPNNAALTNCSHWGLLNKALDQYEYVLSKLIKSHSLAMREKEDPRTAVGR